MKKTVKKIVKRKVAPVPESVKGLKLEHFRLQDRSEFQVGRQIWFQFHYDNLAGKDVGYGSMGMAIHKWTGTEWALHNYKHSYGGPKAKLRAKGGPGDGAFHDDNWKADQPGEFALTPYISFEKAAAHKIQTLKQPAAVGDVSLMAMPVYVTIRHDKPGAVHDSPPAPLFPEKFEEVEVEEVIEVEDEAGAEPGQPGDGASPVAPGTGTAVRPPSSTIPADPTGLDEVIRQVVEWHAGSGVRAVRIELSRRDGDRWLVHTAINQALDADNRVELVFLGSDEESTQ